jgi:hypothetical protein
VWAVKTPLTDKAKRREFIDKHRKMTSIMLRTLVALALLVGAAQAACPFASLWDLTAGE